MDSMRREYPKSYSWVISPLIDDRERQYKRKITAWKLDKNIKDADMKVMLRKQLKRKLEEGKESEFEVNGRPVPPQQMSRFIQRKGMTDEEIRAEQMRESFHGS
jgi:hypothetical protein